MAPERLTPEEFYSRNVKGRAELRDEDGVGTKFRRIRDRFIEELEGNRILDAGCGHGRDTDYFVEQGFEAVGVDISPQMVDYAKENNRGDFHVMDLRNLSFEKESFDGVWTPNSLFFMERVEIKKVLQEFNRVLVFGGKLHAGFKEGDGQYEKERWGDSIIEHRFQEDKILDMLERAGFEIVEEFASESPSGTVFLNYLCRKEG